MPQTLGNDTAKTIFLAREDRKLTQEFKVSVGTIYKGQPVVLHSDGSVKPFTTALQATDAILGYSLHKAVVGANVTVVCSGYMVLMVMVAGATTDTTGVFALTTSGMAKYKAFYAPGGGDTSEYNLVTTSNLAGCEGWLLDVPGGGTVSFAVPFRYLVRA